MAASGTGYLVFIDDVSIDISIEMNSEVYRAILCSVSAKCFKIDKMAIHSADG